MMVKGKLLFITLVLFCAVGVSYGQFDVSAFVGSGASDLQTGFPFSENSNIPNEYLKPGAQFQAGVSAGSTFRKGGMLSWEVQAMIRRSSIRNIPLDYIEEEYKEVEHSNGEVVEALTKRVYHHDYNNVMKWSYWSISVPVSLNFQVFGPIGWKIGGTANWHLTELSEDDARLITNNASLDPYFENFTWQGHTGFFARLIPRLRLEALAYSDFEPRLILGEPNGVFVHRRYREMGFYLNVFYRLN